MELTVSFVLKSFSLNRQYLHFPRSDSEPRQADRVNRRAYIEDLSCLVVVRTSACISSLGPGTGGERSLRVTLKYR